MTNATTTRINLSNDFHNSTVRLIARNGTLSLRQIKRAKSVLCGVAGCTCSGPLGYRGPQDDDGIEIDVGYDGATVTVVK